MSRHPDFSVYQSPERPSVDRIASLPTVVFLAGGVTDCPDWQSRAIARLEEFPVTVMNPRTDDPTEHEAEQIIWEFNMINLAEIIIFYFPCETVCPLSLYELGRCNVLAAEKNGKKLFIGFHPDYCKSFDVTFQTILANNERTYEGFDRLMEEVCSHLKGN